jgi:alpha-beta hydrolase superfamily lysophospholipase
MTDLPIVRTFTDSSGVEITYYEWPIAKPKAIVQIAHGLGEHARRWDDVAEELNRAGYAVYADDHRGHGLTGTAQVASGQTKRLGQLGTGGLPAAYEQVHDFTKLIKSEHEGLPLILLGHSYGSFISQKIIKKYSNDYDAVVLSGSSLMSPIYLNLGPLNARYKKEGGSGFEWLSSVESVGREFAADPLTFYADALKLFGVADALKLFQTPKPTIRKDLPLLIVVGSDDPVGGPRSNEALTKAYIRAGLNNVTMIVYDNARHEIFKEHNRDAAMADLLNFLEQVVKS